jgi:hypothetical protein
MFYPQVLIQIIYCLLDLTSDNCYLNNLTSDHLRYV